MIKIRNIIRRPIYSFFWKKTTDNTNQDASTNGMFCDNLEWKGKEEYLADLRKKREEYEKMKIKQEKESHTQTIRQAREHEVQYGKIDFAKVLVDNINIKYSDEFKHPEELFNFIGTLKV